MDLKWWHISIAFNNSYLIILLLFVSCASLLYTATHHSSQQAVIGVLVACIVVLGIIFLVTILILLIKIRSVSKKTVNSSEEHYNMENVEYEDPDLYRIQTPAKDDEHNIGFDENVAYGRSTAVRQ